MYQFNGRKMYAGNKSVLSFSKKERFSKYNFVNFSPYVSCSSGSEDKQQPVVPKVAGSILLCASISRFFHAVYHRKIPEVLKTAGAKHVFTPLSYGKYFPVVDRCRPASSCVCTGISPSVL
jgi:hypothetical protein